MERKLSTIRRVTQAVPIPKAPLTRAHGIDISYWQDTFDPPLNPPYPVDFVIQRAGHGRWEDALFDELWAGVSQVPIRGAYHYHRSEEDWQMQAEMLMSQADKYDYHFLAWDFEGLYNAKGEKFAHDCMAAMEYLRVEQPRPVLLYTNLNILNTWLAPYVGVWLDDILHWPARWWYFPSPMKDPQWPYPWKIWQYEISPLGSQYGVGSKSVDLDVFNGTVNEMREWLGIAPDPPPDDWAEWKTWVEDKLEDNDKYTEELRAYIEDVDVGMRNNEGRVNALEDLTARHTLEINSLDQALQNHDHDTPPAPQLYVVKLKKGKAQAKLRPTPYKVDAGLFVYAGDKVQLLYEITGWYQVKIHDGLYEGLEGWVHKEDASLTKI